MAYRHLNSVGDEAPSRRSAAVGCLTVLAIFAVIAAAIGYATSYRAIDPQTVALVYGAGPLDPDTGKFDRIVGPGGRHNVGLANKLYPYPTTNRTYVISTEREGDEGRADAVPVSTADTGTIVNVQGIAHFRLNLDPRVLRGFHERQGLKYRAWEDAGWDRMLRELFRNSLQSAITAAGREMTVADFSDGEAVTAFEQRVSQELTTRLEATLGARFFCGPATSEAPTREECGPLTFAMRPYEPPAEIAQANQRQEVAQRNLQAAETEAKAIRKAQNAGLSGMAYVLNEMRKGGTLPQVIVVPAGTDVSVPVAAASAPSSAGGE